MKILESQSFKTAKEYNPWAVCNKSTGGKKEAPEKFERCVQHVKKQNEEDTKPAREGLPHTPETEDAYLDEDKSRVFRQRPLPKSKTNWRDVVRMMNKEKDREEQFQYSSVEDEWLKLLIAK